jgi:hypothetical protein
MGAPKIYVTAPIHVSLAGANGDETIREYARQGAEIGAKSAVQHIEANFAGLMEHHFKRTF